MNNAQKFLLQYNLDDKVISKITETDPNNWIYVSDAIEVYTKDLLEQIKRDDMLTDNRLRNDENAFARLVNHLISKGLMSKMKIAEVSGIPLIDLNDYIIEE